MVFPRWIWNIALVLILAGTSAAQEKELRGVWIAWAGANVPSKAKIAEMMDNLAVNNFNIVYVDVWRYGYPYFRSEVFYEHTGLYTDPSLAAGRDVLADMIAEAHRAGLEVEAWFEAGFSACHESNDDLYDSHPEWFAKKKDGSGIFISNGTIHYRWLSHCNTEAQQFLIDMCREVARRYDVDGIEFDRVRYPSLDCGYDSATVELYKSEHDGAAPPSNTSDSQWIRWRADKLNLFMEQVYAGIKEVNPELTVSNAPLWYGYEQFCQDWSHWINNGFLDVVVPQLYYATNGEYSYRLNIELNKVTDHTRFYPGISTVANGVYTTNQALIDMIETTRSRNLEGHVIWFYDNLVSHFETLKASVYSDPAEIPYREDGWRKPAIIVNETDTTVQRSVNWSTYTSLPGYDGKCLLTTEESGEWIEYSATVPEKGWYEVYMYTVYQWNAHPAARHIVYSMRSADTVYVAQNKPGHERWYKLGDYYFDEGNQKIVRLTDDGIKTHALFADALMLLNTNRVQDTVSSSVGDASDMQPLDFRLNNAWPNPFNGSTQIGFTLQRAGNVRLKVYDIYGRKVADLLNGYYPSGSHTLRWLAEGFSSGIYFITLAFGGVIQSAKVMLIK